MGKIGQRIMGQVERSIHARSERYVVVRLVRPSPLVSEGTRETPGNVLLYVPDGAEMPLPGALVVFVGGIGLDGCLTKAEPDEPIFVLLGRDALAPGVVRAWVADVLAEYGCPVEMDHRSTIPEEERRTLRAVVAAAAIPHPLRAKLVEALDQADAMEAWPARRKPD